MNRNDFPRGPAFSLGRPALALRALAIALSLLALCDLRISLPTRGGAIAILIDGSDSMGDVGRQAARQAAMDILSSLGGKDRVSIALFARDCRWLTRGASPRQSMAILSSADVKPGQGGESDMALAIGEARDALAERLGARAIVLISDGRPTLGRELLSAPRPAGSIPIYTRAVGQSAQGPELVSFELPETAPGGSRVYARARLRSANDQDIKLELWLDGALAAVTPLSIKDGQAQADIGFSLGDRARARVELRALDARGQPIAGIRSGAVIEVGGVSRIALVDGSPGASPLMAALSAQGLSPLRLPYDQLPESPSGLASLDCLILDNIPASSLSAAQQDAIEAYAADGGGLLVVGGPSSLGRGEYYATVLEDVLPVETDNRRRIFLSRSRILFVLDNSGSMSDASGALSKREVAMRGIRASMAELRDQDEVGVLSFDTRPSWVMPFTPVAQGQAILAAVERLEGGGGTDMASAMREVLAGFGESGPTQRHAIILSDGLSTDGDFKDLSSQLKRAGVSVSTIAIGEEVNEGLLRDIATWNDGIYYRAKLGEVPSLIARETVRLSRELIQSGDFPARRAQANPILDGINPASIRPRAYLITRPKALASVPLELGPAGGTKAGLDPATGDPLLALWNYGAGQVAVFSSDSGRDWSAPWVGTPDYQRFWAQLTRGLSRRFGGDRLETTIRQEGGLAVVEVEALGGEDGQDQLRRVGLNLMARALDQADQVPVPLVEELPGRYSARLALGKPGLQEIEVFEEGGQGRGLAWIWNAGSAEDAGLGPDREFMAQLAQNSGGQALGESTYGGTKAKADESPILPGLKARGWKRVELKGFLLVAAPLIFLLELFCRSAWLGQARQALASLSRWWAWQSAAADQAIKAQSVRPEEAPVSPPSAKPRDDSDAVVDAYLRIALKAKARAEKEQE